MVDPLSSNSAGHTMSPDIQNLHSRNILRVENPHPINHFDGAPVVKNLGIYW